ncbi:MAG: hypothetical protein PUK76_10230 [Treponema sp.]|nr:hypothetical protein [Treponema sp.]
MSFFKDFKEDLSQAVNELVPGEDAADAMEQDNDVVVVNTLEDELDVESELSKLDGLLEKVTKDANTPVEKAAPVQETKVETPVAEVKEENDFIINDVQEILKSVDSVESLAEQSEEVISNAFEYLEEYADSFIISADKEQRKKDEAEYEEIQNLLMLFYDEEDGFSEENF